MASVMDRYLPLIEPVGRAILDRLPVLPEGANVLDVACGTGEPGLTLARKHPSVRLLGIDGVPDMVAVARAKSSQQHLENARFEVMNAERLACKDQSFDAMISRFGLLMFGDTAACAKEMRRVLRRGGAFSLAVWDDMATNTLVRTVMNVLRPVVPAELAAPFDAAPGRDAGEHLRDAGLTDVQSVSIQWAYAFTDDVALWEFVSGPGLFARHFAGLHADAARRVNERLLSSLDEYRSEDGRYRIPHACRLWWGTSR